MKESHWFKVTTDADGKVISCEIVDKAGTDRGGVFYFRASAATVAQRRAVREYHRLKSEARRKRFMAEGLCHCGRDPIPGTKRCKYCVESVERYRERKRRQDAGERVAAPDKAETTRLRREADRAEWRLDALEEVAEILARQGTVALREWLRRQLRQRAKGQAA